mgnify:CR=1 FL=1
MSFVSESAIWESGIYQIETSDRVVGGPDGIANKPTKDLANRTLWLRSQFLAQHNADGSHNASFFTDVSGTDIGNLVGVVDVNGVPGLPALSGRNLTHMAGTDIGDFVKLEDVNGIAGLPPVDGSQLINMVSGIAWSVKTTDFTAEDVGGYLVDTSSGSITVTLPASPEEGTQLSIKDYKYNANNYNITVVPNGNPIEGNSENFVIATEGYGCTLVFSEATTGWIIVDEMRGKATYA